jgi:prepilin-type N-terminal cleavage/methylation domain-containing protein
MEFRTDKKRRRRITGGTQDGFSLLEMTMGIVLFGIVLGAMLSLLEVGRRTRLNTLEQNEDLQDVRIALNQMSRDVLNAGVDYPNVGPLLPTNWLWNHAGLAKSSPTAALDNMPPVIPGCGEPGCYPAATLGGLIFTGSAAPNSTLTKTTTPAGTSICDQVTLVSVNYLLNSGNAVQMAGTNHVSTSSQTATLQVTSPTANLSGASTVCNIGDVCFLWSATYPTGVIGIVTSLAQTAAANDSMVFAASTDPLGLNSFLTGTTDIAAVGNSGTVYSYKLDFVTYYVKDDGTGRGTGTLMRRSYGGASGATPIAFTDQPLAFDVSSMTITYTMADTSTTSNPTLANFQNIRQIEVSVTVQSPSKVQLANPSAVAAPTPFAAETLTAILNTRNLGYEKN